jgi:5-methylcytosine-specific restriction endonuclease McrA
MIKTCPACEKEWKAKGTTQIYCSRECANSSPDRRNKISKSRKQLLSTENGKSMYKRAMEKRNELPYYQRRETRRKRERDIISGRSEYKQWRLSVIKRDNYTCQSCKTRGGILQVHHIKSWAEYPDLRFDTDNGITYCLKCHRGEHGYWMHSDKTCPMCGNKFIPHQMKQVCCSIACRASLQSIKAKENRPVYTCSHCKTQFSKNAPRKYCSRACYWASMRMPPCS